MKIKAKHKNQLFKNNKIFLETMLPNLCENIVVGEQFIDIYEKCDEYYLLFGNGNYPLVGIISVTDMLTNKYYSTGEGFVAVHLIENNSNYNYETPFARVPGYEQFVKEHPVVLYFLGRDDGSYGKQFKSKEDALEYLKNIGSLENMLEQDIGYDIYSEFKKRKEYLDSKNLYECFNSSLLYIN